MKIHYIYINKHDKFDESIPIELEKLLEKYQEVHQGDATVKIHGYQSLLSEIKEYDSELGAYFSLINPLFANVLSNIGRIFLLYRHGGFYHDANWFIKKRSAYSELTTLISDKDIVLERHPQVDQNPQIIRNSNMWARSAGNAFFKNILEKQKQNLARIKAELEIDHNAKHECFRETGVRCVINELIEMSDYQPDPIMKQEGLSTMQQIVSKNQDLNKEDYSLDLNGLKIEIIRLARFFRNNKKFYNTSKEDHWSVYQKTQPILNLN